MNSVSFHNLTALSDLKVYTVHMYCGIVKCE